MNRNSENQSEIEGLYEAPALSPGDRPIIERFLEDLDQGRIRAAQPIKNGWKTNRWVKKGILLGFRIGILKDFSEGSQFSYFDKDTYPLKSLDLQSKVRVVPGGSAIRYGAYVSPGVTCMPPMYINVGAWVGPDTMIDSHALVGSCAQIGARVHVSAAAQIGGVLEPIGASPVIIENDVLIGGNCGVYEGALISEGAILASGVTLTKSTPVYDLVREEVYRADSTRPLTIPPGAVVVPGSRALKGGFGERKQLSLYTPIIVKYRDGKTDTSVQLEEWLRS
jgi:2,3,4,5-tetrahydropyridine-2-carboxylate N-succinyltransferase